jgi:hypothetical protein
MYLLSRTFFASVSPLICVFWMQLTRTNAVFSRIALVSRFCAEIQLSAKIRENIEKPYFTRRPSEPENKTEWGWEATTQPGGAAQSWPRPPVVWPPWPSPRPLLPPTYTLWPKRSGGSTFFPDRLPLRCRHQKPRFETRNSVLAPCRDGDLEEIFITIITDVSPSTINDYPIHVWVILAVGEGDGRDLMRSFM